MAESKRQQKFSRLIQRELAIIFQQDLKHWFSGNMISVTEVTVTPDLKIAKVFVTLMLADNPEASVEKIASRKGEIKKVMGRRIGKSVRSIPDLQFYYDHNLDHADHMDKILSQLNIPKEDEEE